MRRSEAVARWLVLLGGLVLAPAPQAHAGAPLNPITDIAWQEIFPITIAGVTIQGNATTSPSDFSAISSPVCICPAPPPLFLRAGIPIGLWEPARVIETVKDAYYFPMLGTRIGGGDSPRRDGSRGSHSSGATTTAFQQAHYWVFPVWAILELLIDNVCFESSGFDLAYITEVDPLWQEDALAMIIQPEVLLFANAAAQLACAADATATAAGHPLDPLFWCVGSGGSVYPLTGHVSGNNFTMANATVAARMFYKLARQLLVCDTGIDVCGCVPTPIWAKSHYKLQIARPVRGSKAVPFGQSDYLWGSGKNPPMGAAGNEPDDFLWVLFRKRLCCVFRIVRRTGRSASVRRRVGSRRARSFRPPPAGRGAACTHSGDSTKAPGWFALLLAVMSFGLGPRSAAGEIGRALEEPKPAESSCGQASDGLKGLPRLFCAKGTGHSSGAELARNAQEAEGLERAVDTLRWLESTEFQRRLQAEQARIQLEALGPDLKAHGVEDKVGKGTSRGLAPTERLYLFISESVPLETLRNYVRDVAEIGDPRVVIVLRGFVGGMRRVLPTKSFLFHVLRKDLSCDPELRKDCELQEASVIIDPLLFRRYDVQVVPTLVYAQDVLLNFPSGSEGLAENTSVQRHWRISGDAAMHYLLAQVHKDARSESLKSVLVALGKAPR